MWRSLLDNRKYCDVFTISKCKYRYDERCTVKYRCKASTKSNITTLNALNKHCCIRIYE